MNSSTSDPNTFATFAAVILRTGRLPTLARVAAVFSFAWGIIAVADRFDLFAAPRTGMGFTLFVLASVSAALATELVVLAASRPSVPPLRHPNISPERAFAQSVVSYAAALGSNDRDDAVIELRSWATRFLHLGAMLAERMALGEIALKSAMAKADRPTQASILMDDLGWTAYEHGDVEKALTNIGEAIGVLDRELVDRRVQNSEELKALKAKALRHQANINAATAVDLSAARNAFEAPRALATELHERQRSLHLAQIDHSEAHVISMWLTRNLGASGRIEPLGKNAKLLEEAVDLATRAERSFQELGDKEREIKALQLLCELLEHHTKRQPALEANARLHRLRSHVARIIDRSQLAAIK